MRILDNKTICIVGGGSSGFMASLYLTIHHPDKNIILIESPTIPKIGVGEGSTQHIRVFLANMGIDTYEFLKYTEGTYKFSIRFRDFLKDNHDIGIHYPFGGLSYEPKYLKAWMNFINHNPKYKDLTDRVISNQVMFCDNNLTGSIPNFNIETDSAFHFDAILFSEFLKEKNKKYHNFKHVINTVKNIIKDEEGYITELECENGEKIKADLYIDCTGFSKFLIGREKFHSLHDKLPVNKAWACRLSYDNRYKELTNFTDCVGLSAGWSWLIPLYNRLGCGYVFSDKFISDEDALVEFKQYLNSKKINLNYNPNRTDDLNFRLVPFEAGYQKEAWQKNIISIGLSAGFLEPLEANGLLSTHELIKELSTVLKREKLTPFDKALFNKECEFLIEGWSNFLHQHYVISEKNNPFWNHFKSEDNPYFETFMNNIDYDKPRRFHRDNSGGMRIYLGAGVSIANDNYDSTLYNLPYKMIHDYNLMKKEIHFKYTNNYVYLKKKLYESI